MPKSVCLDLYTDYLIAGVGQTKDTGFSSVLGNHVIHDMATQLLSSGYISSRRLRSMVKPMCEEVEDENGVLITDNSIEAKPYTDCNDLICWHFDHTVNRSVKGVNFVSAIYSNWKMSLPIGVCFVNKDVSYVDKAGKTKRKSSLSRQEYFRTLVKHGTQHLRFRYVPTDSWFACSLKNFHSVTFRVEEVEIHILAVFITLRTHGVGEKGHE